MTGFGDKPRIHIITLGVEDLSRATDFYRALGFETSADSDENISFFKTGGVTLALYPREGLAQDISPDFPADPPAFSGVSLAHVARSHEAVEELLAEAQAAGGTIVKPAEDVFWGGYSGYFADPDGHVWEVAYSKEWRFHDDGALVIE